MHRHPPTWLDENDRELFGTQGLDNRPGPSAQPVQVAVEQILNETNTPADPANPKMLISERLKEVHEGVLKDLAEALLNTKRRLTPPSHRAPGAGEEVTLAAIGTDYARGPTSFVEEMEFIDVKLAIQSNITRVLAHRQKKFPPQKLAWFHIIGKITKLDTRKPLASLKLTNAAPPSIIIDFMNEKFGSRLYWFKVFTTGEKFLSTLEH